jgi:3-dehydroquinate synthase
MSKVVVDLGDRTYPIYIGAHILSDSEIFRAHIESRQALLVTNHTLEPMYAGALKKTLSFVEKLDIVTLPDGEAHKNLNTVNMIFDRLLRAGHNRKTTLIALGGGVVGDMTGFAAACYQRGVNFIQVPTTLLAQVDSSVGGKTGVNHALGKNMIGAFYQPRAVIIDTALLVSLSDRELAAGLAEVIKYGLIADQSFFVWLEDNIDKLLQRQAATMEYAIKRCCEIKAEIVAEDEKEGGLREILNFGHTFGHAIEAAEGYGSWLHGEAVATGMIMACKLSVKLGWLEQAWLDRAQALIGAAGLPKRPPQAMTEQTFMKYIAVDKKVLDQQLRLILLKDCGEALVTSDFPPELLSQVLNDQ